MHALMADWRARLVRPTARTLVLAGVAILAVLAVAGGVWYWHTAAERRAAAAYASALGRLAASRAPEAGPARTAAATELEAALASYPSSSMAGQAALQLGNVRYADRQYPAARRAYEIAVARAGSGTVRTMARLGVGATWEAERDFARAIEAYRAAVNELGPEAFEYEEALIDLGRAQELGGRKDDAIATYRRLLKDVPATRRAEDVRIRLASLGATP